MVSGIEIQKVERGLEDKASIQRTSIDSQWGAYYASISNTTNVGV